MEIIGVFPFMLSLVEAFIGFFSGIRSQMKFFACRLRGRFPLPRKWERARVRDKSIEGKLHAQ